MIPLFQRPIHHIGFLTLILGGAFVLSTTDAKGIRTLWTLRQETQIITREIQALQIRLQELTQNIEHFRTQPSHQERLVRNQTGYLRQNELLIEWL